jgi:hypothetical protein
MSVPTAVPTEFPTLGNITFGSDDSDGFLGVNLELSMGLVIIILVVFFMVMACIFYCVGGRKRKDPNRVKAPYSNPTREFRTSSKPSDRENFELVHNDDGFAGV